jgi:hypothetical protein
VASIGSPNMLLPIIIPVFIGCHRSRVIKSMYIYLSGVKAIVLYIGKLRVEIISLSFIVKQVFL